MNKVIGNAPDKLYIIIPAIINMLLNLIYVTFDIIKIIKKKEKNKITSLEKFLQPLSISEIMISLFWVVSGFLPSEIVESDTPECRTIGCFQTFFYSYELLLLQEIISHLRHLILNPLTHILKSKMIILKSILINAVISIVITLLYFFCGIIGISPMYSCFLKYEIFFDDKIHRKILLILLLLIPLFVIAYIIYQIIIILKNASYQNDSLNKQLFKTHIFYLFAYLLIFFLFPILYFVIAIKGENIELFSFIVSLFLVVLPIIIGMFRLYKNRINFSIGNFINSKRNDAEKTLRLLDLSNLSKTLTFQEQAVRFEISAIKKFVMNFYISVCFCLEKNLLDPHLKYQDFRDDNIDKTNSYTITQEIILDQIPDGQLIGDSIVRAREKFSISCVEYSPSIFSYLRQLDQVSDEMIVKSMLPMNNKIGIKETEGRGGSFFINSDDHEFIIKTITEQEFKIMMRLLHNKMVDYFKTNNDSLICRIYGAYKLSISTGWLKNDDIYFILMKNVIGSFFDNLLCKYDLKGSSLNRKVGYENMDKKVMKDINFNEVEEIFFLNKQDSKKLLKFVEKDANFLCSSGVMDYSLLVAKITLNNDEMNYLFGKDHRKNAEIQYMQMIGQERQTVNVSIDNIDVKGNKKDNDNEKDNLIIDEESKIRFDKDNIACLKKYIFPSLKPDIIYIMSIIDYFQIYNLQKNLEQKYKKFKTGVKKEDISSIPPDEYKDRFIEFLKNKTDSEHYLRQLYNPLNQNDF